MRRLLPAVLAAFLGLPGAMAPAAEAVPDFSLERCCDLCPATRDRAAYNTRYLEFFPFLIQGKDQWLFRTEQELSTEFGPDAESLQELRRFKDALRRRGSELVMAYLPTRGLMHPDKLGPAESAAYDHALAASRYAAALQRFRAAGIVVPELTRLLVQDPAQPPYFFKRDHHWSPWGAQQTARVVADRVRQMPAFASVPRSEFATEVTGLMRKQGSLQVAATQLCGFGYADQYVPQFKTSQKSDGDLFGEESLPQIALAGTSYSGGAFDYNFAGFLQEQLGAEVLNVAVAGGSFDGTWMQYLLTDAFQKSPPKILIWEVPAYHPIANRAFYRQVIPMTYDGCANRPAVFSRTLTLQPGSNEVLFNGGGQVLDIRSRDYLIDLRFSDPRFKKFSAAIAYINGRQDKIKLEHAKRVEGQGRFVMELRQDGEWQNMLFLSLTIDLPETRTEPLAVEARLCARQDIAVAAPRVLQ